MQGIDGVASRPGVAMVSQTDVVIVGGGLAGSTAAAMLARQKIDVVMVDPHRVYPPDFRCEKLDGVQVGLLRKTGLADAVLRVATPDAEAWVAQLGRVVDRRRGDQQGILYGDLVNTIRREIPSTARVVHGKAETVATSAMRQSVRLSDGETISARLVVMANGLNASLRQSMGLERRIISACHSVTIGFNVKPLAGRDFPFSSLSYYGERAADRVAYLTLFPVGNAMRANFMVYRDLHDPWLDAFRERPREMLLSVLRNLDVMTGGFEVSGHIKIRPADLYVTQGIMRPGMVLVGDAFSTSCPAAGTGTGKVFTDVERLCNVHVPDWLASEGMGEDKIAAFYADPVKRAYDRHTHEKAFGLKDLSVGKGMSWQARRRARFCYRLCAGLLRRAKGQVRPRRVPAPAATVSA